MYYEWLWSMNDAADDDGRIGVEVQDLIWLRWLIVKIRAAIMLSKLIGINDDVEQK